jgi:uncharacterized protein (TIGR02466 family)
MIQPTAIEEWFPVAFYVKEDLFSKQENELLAKHCLQLKDATPMGRDGWLGNTYNTLGTYDLYQDQEFQPLISLITEHVNEFAKISGCADSYAPHTGWFNIADSGAYQEFHAHNANVFSAVYYISAPENSGSIMFEDPKEPDMFPLKDIQHKNKLNITRVMFPAKQGLLLIFRSYLRHLVEQGSNIVPRISLALNYK